MARRKTSAPRRIAQETHNEHNADGRLTLKRQRPEPYTVSGSQDEDVRASKRSELEGAEYDGESEVLEMEKQVEDDRGKEAVEHKDVPNFDGLLCLPVARLPEEEMRFVSKLAVWSPEEDSNYACLRDLSKEKTFDKGLHLAFGKFKGKWAAPETVPTALVIDATHEGPSILGTLQMPCPSLVNSLVFLFRRELATLVVCQAGSSSGGCEMLLAVTTRSISTPEDEAARVCKQWIEVMGFLLPEYGEHTLFPAGLDRESGSDGPASPRSRAANRHATGGDAAAVYAAVRPTGREPELEGDFPQLSVQLRPYQRRAAGWMVEQEINPPKAACHPLLHAISLYDSRGSKTGRHLHYNPFDGSFVEGAPPPEPVHGGILADEMGLGKTVEVLACIMANCFKGPGLAAAEGLEGTGRPAVDRVDCLCGATEEDENFRGLWVQCDACLAWVHGKCVGFPKRAPEGPFVCGPCQRMRTNAEVTGECGATLIVCPRPIFEQWRQEIDKHIQPGALKVVSYEGQSRGAGKSRVVTAAELASADIVVTTYDSLAHDIYHVPLSEVHSYPLRHGKKYELLATPLTRLTWWRVCLDEAQMIESGTAKAAKLASQLKAVHRWAITGTPINSGLHDLFGLMTFLKAKPYDTKFMWQHALEGPMNEDDPAGWARVVAALRPAHGGLLWRSSKQDVKGELQLPPQERTLTSLELSPIERHFYNKQHEWCASKAQSVLSSHLIFLVQRQRDVDDEEAQRKLSRAEERALLQPLLRLRQACCHPQVGAGGIRQLQPKQKPMTMDEILEMLITKARNEAEEAQRLLLFALNGLGALFLLGGEDVQAIQSYREALKVAEANESHIKADSLQQLHALHNLATLLEERPEGVAPTLRDATLQKHADAIRERYMAQWWAKLAAAEKEQGDSAAAVEKASRSADGKVDASLSEGGSWFLQALEVIQENAPDGAQAAVDRIKDQLVELNSDNTKLTRNATSLAKRIRSAQSLKLVLHEKLSAMEGARQAALEELEKLGEASRELTPELVEQAGQCGRCRADLGQAGRVCRHCRLDELLMAWELRLFSLQAHAVNKRDSVTAEDALRQAQQSALTRVGRGGLGEDAAVGDAEAGPSGARRGEATGVTYADVVHNPSEAEQLLKLIQGQLRALRRLPPHAAEVREEILAAGKRQLDRLEAMRKFFVKSRTLSLAQRELLYAKDELEMCTMRMRLRMRGEAVRPSEAHFKLHRAEVPVKKAERQRAVQELTGDKVTADAELSKTLGTLRYLTGLKAARSEQGSATDPAAAYSPECPVCHEPLPEELMMLPCGHALCYNCSEELSKHAHLSPQAGHRRKTVRKIHCPTCRASVPTADMVFIRPAKEACDKASPSSPRDEKEALEENSIPVKGSFGTKLEAVVRRIKWLTSKDPTARALVFSSWNDVLDVLSHALSANEVNFAYVKNAKQLGPAIRALQEAGKGKGVAGNGSRPLQTVLLPIKQGANGLNLTEAQHVILVEPLLDPAVEAQAVGRVDRIGQKKKTFVHNFVVSETVEKNVYELNRERASTVDVASVAANRMPKGDQQFTVRDVALLLEKPWAARGAPVDTSASP